MSAAQHSTPEPVRDAQLDSALFIAARQLSEEASLRPRLAGLTGLRRRDAARRSRRAARRMTVMPAS